MNNAVNLLPILPLIAVAMVWAIGHTVIMRQDLKLQTQKVKVNHGS